MISDGGNRILLPYFFNNELTSKLIPSKLTFNTCSQDFMSTFESISSMHTSESISLVDDLTFAKSSNTTDDLTHYIPELRAFIASKTRDISKIDDATQETIARTYKSANIAVLKNPLAYMITVAKTVLYDQWKSSIDVDTSVDLDSISSTSSTIEQQHIDFEKIKAVSCALNKMPRLRRKVFEMRRLQGMPREQIAQELELSLDSVKKHINRAIVDITLHMENHGW